VRATNRKTAVSVLAVLSAALLSGVTVSQQAQAAPGRSALPPFLTVAFYTGSELTGTEHTADLTDNTCHNLTEPALSALNYAAVDVDVYYNPDCRTGEPGKTGDLYMALGSLHWAELSYPGLSYRVRSGS